MRNKRTSRKFKLKRKRLEPENYLIVFEVKKTEPNYFNGLRKKIKEKYGDKVDVLIPSIEVKGTGRNTIDLRHTYTVTTNQNAETGLVDEIVITY